MESGSSVGGPLDILKLLIDTRVVVELKDLSQIKGILKGFDEHVNLILYKAQGTSQSSDILFIRGDLVCLIKEN